MTAKHNRMYSLACMRVDMDRKSGRGKRERSSGRERGFTLIEVIVVAVMMSILCAMAITSLSSTGSELRAAAYNLRTELLSAKAEAIKRNENIRVDFAPGTNSYNATAVNSGEVILKNSLKRNLNLTTNNTTISFSPLCTATNGKVFISGSGNTYEIAINGVGRVSVQP